MKLTHLRIENYRSCKDVTLELSEMHALVGANNAGKSSILRALDFLFNPSVTKIDEEAFWNRETESTIRVEARFTELLPDEAERLSSYLRRDGSFHMARTARVVIDNDETAVPSLGDVKIEIGQEYCRLEPKEDWLREVNVSMKAISGWWKDKQSMVVNGNSFVDYVNGKKPSVGEWKEKAASFAREYLSEEDYEVCWTQNPRGYSNVLKAALPMYILVPAVRDVSDEVKVTKSNPLGTVLATILDRISQAQREPLEEALSLVRRQLNKEGGSDRIPSVTKVEGRLNEILGEYMDCSVELEFEAPTLQTLLSSPRLHADDGFKNIVENKGHGLQRAVIFSILRLYSEVTLGDEDSRSRTLMFAIEEPELYMHPQAQRTLRRVLRDLSDGGDQVIFSTHSAHLVDVAYFDEIVRVVGERTAISSGSGRTVNSKTWQLPMSRMLEDLRVRYPKVDATPHSMRERYSHAYHPLRAEGFFAEKVVLVEGPTEAYSIPIYAAAVGYPLDKNNVAVVECGGKGQMDRLYQVFNELGIPCYLIFDYDEKSDDAESIRTSRDLLKFVGESPEPPRGIAVLSSVTVFPNNWEEDLESEIPDYEELKSEARGELGDCGKPLVARFVARRLTKADPPAVPPTVSNIIKQVKGIAWSGSCLKSAAG